MSLGAFQYGEFQPDYQIGLPPPSGPPFGWAQVCVAAPSAAITTSVPCAVASIAAPYAIVEIEGAASMDEIIVGSACYVNASFFDETGAAMVPEALSYRIDDLASGTQILDWTSIGTPAATVQVLITGAQNNLVSSLAIREEHQVLFQITDTEGNAPFYSRTILKIVQAPGV